MIGDRLQLHAGGTNRGERRFKQLGSVYVGLYVSGGNLSVNHGSTVKILYFLDIQTTSITCANLILCVYLWMNFEDKNVCSNLPMS
jgi:hypothetical protein